MLGERSAGRARGTQLAVGVELVVSLLMHLMRIRMQHWHGIGACAEGQLDWHVWST